jgi:RimJ/RimL family protein N-acetyltransferase
VLRPAQDSDVADIRAWRNQPTNREASIQQHEIGPDEHRDWWDRTKGDARRRVLIFEAGGAPLGVVNFFDLDLDSPTRTGSWGFFLDHETAANEGTALLLWTRIMSEAIAYAFDDLGLDVLHAEVLADNVAVRRMNGRYGFVEAEPQDREVEGEARLVVPISLRRQDRRLRRV